MQRAMVLEELDFSQRVVSEGHEVAPRFHVLAPDYEHTIMVQFPNDIDKAWNA